MKVSKAPPSVCILYSTSHMTFQITLAGSLKSIYYNAHMVGGSEVGRCGENSEEITVVYSLSLSITRLLPFTFT